MTIQATSDGFTIASANSAASAYCRFLFTPEFFKHYKLQRNADSLTFATPQDEAIVGELKVKGLLAIIKPRGLDRSVEKIVLEIHDGPEFEKNHGESSTRKSSVESKFLVRAHCKHGVIKTHKLIIDVNTTVMTPRVPDASTGSRVTIGSEVIKDILDHFPMGKAMKSDPQLIWHFSGTDVRVRSLEGNTKEVNFVSTELRIGADEFEEYYVLTPPITLKWHLREFNATIALAESINIPIELKFTQPDAPLSIAINTERYESFFAISTAAGEVNEDPESRPTRVGSKRREREPEADPPPQPVRKRSNMVVTTSSARSSVMPSGSAPRQPDPPQPQRSPSTPAAPGADREAASPPFHQSTGIFQSVPPSSNNAFRQPTPQEPLFLPGSQAPPPPALLTQADHAFLEQAGLDVENADELFAMMEDEGEEVDIPPSQVFKPIAPSAQSEPPILFQKEEDGSSTEEDDVEDSFLPSTQARSASDFRPLFDD
ncbi:hypothetical protein SISSUDRAFT_1061996 [Sistotremastrum suecicum HHB10207 ss-3]|uniref:Rad9-domain-containing protein n=1 Tax=Sistotremastrum suecicum HHB10207 ss-3 TaxID=1314776 RepID=A0A166DEY2_9AGAM|nr:hypothetical protein SISSUDRAFT_1061996 [Sistotremastrum suecicum HHB10207 ss-3]